MTYLISGDTHGAQGICNRLSRIEHILGEASIGERALIILGDAGLNFYLNGSERNAKKKLAYFNTYIYCVRGNHEERPENLGYEIVYDENVKGNVYIDRDNSLIRYFLDGGEYIINGFTVLTIGGAYSIDKYYRIERAAALGQSFTGWFEGEQLTQDERDIIVERVGGKHFDFVLTHTCPLSWEPRDLFLNGIDQSAVDKSMETWLDWLKDNITWGHWCFGHHHADRIELPRVEIFFNDYESIDTIAERWTNFDATGELDWWINLSPNFRQELIENE